MSTSTWSPAGSAYAGVEGDLVESAAERTELPMSGASGARLEQLVMADATRLVMKEISPEWDWMMPATRDTGRAAELWVSGAMDRCPAVIDPAIVRIEGTDRSWRIYMRDVSEHFLRRGSVVSRNDAVRFLRALSELHAAYWLDPPNGLCALEDLLGLVAPRTATSLVPAEHPFRAESLRGWEIFFDIAPADVAGAVSSVLDDPSDLATRLRQSGTTLLHSDPHYGNVAPMPDRFVLLDWSLASAGPPALDFAWYLDQSARFIDATRDDLTADFRAAEGDRHDERVLWLALLAELVLAGWQYTGAVEDPDEADRAGRRADFDWWTAAARRGLEAW